MSLTPTARIYPRSRRTGHYIVGGLSEPPDHASDGVPRRTMAGGDEFHPLTLLIRFPRSTENGM